MELKGSPPTPRPQSLSLGGIHYMELKGHVVGGVGLGGQVVVYSNLNPLHGVESPVGPRGRVGHPGGIHYMELKGSHTIKGRWGSNIPTESITWS